MADKLPYFRWFPKDAETSEAYASMTDAELGFYHRCLNRAWLNDGLPSDPSKRAQALQKSRAYADKMWAGIVAERFSLDENGRYRNPRQEEERTKAIRKSEQASEAVSERERKRNARSSDDESIDDLRAQARPGSGSGSVVVETTTETKTSTRAREPERGLVLAEKPTPEEVIAELESVYRQAGCPISLQHKVQALAKITRIHVSKRHRLPDYCKWALTTGRWPNPAKTKALMAVLKDGDWDVELVARTLPNVSAENSVRDEARRQFLELNPEYKT